jgi:ribose transport system ATP-binding protein
VNHSLLQTVDLNKTYGSTLAATDINISIQRGRVHALVGENGAGKSTVIKMITGLVRPTSGHLRWEGDPITIHSPREAQSLGIVAVQQELTLVDTMTVAQNIWLGHEPYRAAGTIDRRAVMERSAGLIGSMELSIDPAATVGKLSLSEKQLVEILKALSYDPKLLILDEATSTLDDKEVEVLHGIVEKLRRAGCGIVFVSHRMKEIFQFCEFCTIMKDGRVVLETPTAEIDEPLIIAKMTGREVALRRPADALNAGIPLVPEDRKSEGLFVDRTVEENMVACSLKKCSRLGVLSASRMRSLVSSLTGRMDVKAPSPKESVRRLSGGNQQKVAVGRWLAEEYKVFLLIEPTRGIDVGTKTEIYELLRRLAARGAGIIVATNELIELVGLCDTVLVLFEHRLSNVLKSEEINEHNILTASFGHGGVHSYEN